MRVVLIEIEGIGPVFFSETASHPLAPGEHKSRISRARRRLMTALEHPQGWVMTTLARFWTFLHSRIDPDEPMLRGFRHAETLLVEHPSTILAREAQESWRLYLARRGRRHRNWFLIDAVLAPLSIVLGLLPGPNVVGYWILYRTIVHAMAMRGASRAKLGKIPTVFDANPRLDLPLDPADEETITRLSSELELPDLSPILVRIAGQPHPLREPS